MYSNIRPSIIYPPFKLLTKRSISSHISLIFDPLELLGTVDHIESLAIQAQLKRIAFLGIGY